MKYDVVKVKENKDGSATVVLDCDDEFINYCVSKVVNETLMLKVKELEKKEKKHASSRTNRKQGSRKRHGS